MSRKVLKNIIMLVILIVTVGLTGVTIYQASGWQGPENGKVEKPNNIEFENGREIKTDGAFLSTTYYILFGIEGAIIGFIIMYLIVTKRKYNKKRNAGGTFDRNRWKGV